MRSRSSPSSPGTPPPITARQPVASSTPSPEPAATSSTGTSMSFFATVPLTLAMSLIPPATSHPYGETSLARPRVVQSFTIAPSSSETTKDYAGSTAPTPAALCLQQRLARGNWLQAPSLSIPTWPSICSSTLSQTARSTAIPASFYSPTRSAPRRITSRSAPIIRFRQRTSWLGPTSGIAARLLLLTHSTRRLQATSPSARWHPSANRTSSQQPY